MPCPLKIGSLVNNASLFYEFLRFKDSFPCFSWSGDSVVINLVTKTCFQLNNKHKLGQTERGIKRNPISSFCDCTIKTSWPDSDCTEVVYNPFGIGELE